MKTGRIILLIILICPVSGQDIEGDRSNWVDPHDMLNYDSYTKSMKKQEEPVDQIQVKIEQSEETDLELNEKVENNELVSSSNAMTECNQIKQQYEDCKKQVDEQSFCEKKQTGGVFCDAPYFKRFIHQLISYINKKNYRYEFIVQLDPGDYESLQTFVSREAGNVNDIEDILSRMIIKSSPLESDIYVESIFDVLLQSRTSQICSLLFAVIAVFLFVWVVISRLSLFKLILTFCIVVFLCSVFWHWQNMYQAALARRHAELSKHQEIPKECQAEMSSVQGIKFWFKTEIIGWNDPCVDYHQAMLVDPFWDVSPAMAFSETITRICVQPLNSLGTHIGKFYHGLHHNSPFGVSFMVMCFTFIFVMFAFILFCGYRVRLPFGIMSIEPASIATVSSRSTASVEQLSQEVITVRKMVEILAEKPLTAIKNDQQSQICYQKIKTTKCISNKSANSELTSKCKCESTENEDKVEIYRPEAGEPCSNPYIAKDKQEFPVEITPRHSLENLEICASCKTVKSVDEHKQIETAEASISEESR